MRWGGGGMRFKKKIYNFNENSVSQPRISSVQYGTILVGGNYRVGPTIQFVLEIKDIAIIEVQSKET